MVIKAKVEAQYWDWAQQKMKVYTSLSTGCLLNIVFFRKFQSIFRALASLGFSSVCTPDFMLGPLNDK